MNFGTPKKVTGGRGRRLIKGKMRFHEFPAHALGGPLQRSRAMQVKPTS